MMIAMRTEDSVVDGAYVSVYLYFMRMNIRC